MTNKSMLVPREARKREAGVAGKSEKSRAEEAHPQAPQLKPVLNEHKRGDQSGHRQEGSKSRDL